MGHFIKKSRLFPKRRLGTARLWGLGLLVLSAAIGLGASRRFRRDRSGSASASNGAARAADGLRVDVFAGSELIANPAALAVDARGRVWVAETALKGAGGTSPARVGLSEEQNLDLRTAQDRLDVLHRHAKSLAVPERDQGDRLRRVEDSDGDGRADRSAVVIEGFDPVTDGPAAGLLTRGRDVWLASTPNLWRFHDLDGGDRPPEDRDRLLTGFGVHLGAVGHCLHGLQWGPDGKVYFTIGDIGCRDAPDTGSVLRCEPDGAGLEVFATGLRNPMELVFDEFGNLFTADNNQGPTDLSRVVHVIEGADHGWRLSALPIDDTPYVREGLWREPWPGQAAYVVPAVAATKVINCPSGLAYFPGTGLPERYRGHFLLGNFSYTEALSGVLAFTMTPRGGSFAMSQPEVFASRIIPTDVEFANDGGVFVTSWEEGGNPSEKGRIVRISDPAPSVRGPAREVAALLAQGTDHQTNEELIGRLGHADVRIRREAQFTLAERGGAAVPRLLATARAGRKRLARVHALWALGQVARQRSGTLAEVVDLLEDPDEEVRAQAARVLGDEREVSASAAMVRRLGDPAPRVRLFAAIGVGKLRSRAALGPLLAMLRDDGGRDPSLRHAAVMGLAGCAGPESLAAARIDAAPAVRLGLVVALRRLASPEVARFLDDHDPNVVFEAGRAINDLSIPAAMPALAALVERPFLPDPLLRRAIHARAVIGRPEDLRLLADFAARDDLALSTRLLALRLLFDWTDPPHHDPVTGYWRDTRPRAPEAVADAVRPVLVRLLKGPPPDVLRLAIRVAGRSGLREAVPELIGLAGDAQLPGEVRAQALGTLQTLDSRGASRSVEAAMADPDEALRLAAIRLLAASHPPDQAAARLEPLLDAPALAVRQAAWDALGQVPGAAADRLCALGLERLNAGRIAPEIELELVEAARRRSSEACRRLLRSYEASKPENDPVALRREGRAGGSAERGRAVFARNGEFACLRCHSIGLKIAGGHVGPDLDRLGLRLDRGSILESLVDPSRRIGAGYQTTILALRDGRVISGRTVERTTTRLVLALPDGGTFQVAPSEIEAESRGRSAMPDDIVKGLSDRDLRDLVAYLASLGTEANMAGRALRLQEKLPRRGLLDYYQAGIR